MTQAKSVGCILRAVAAEDVGLMRDRLREEDVREVLAAGFDGAGSALAESLACSLEAGTLERDGVPVAMFGLAPVNLAGGCANVWLLGTPEIERVKVTFARASRAVVADWLSRWPCLVALCDGRYAKALRWLGWLGGRVERTEEIGGVPFHWIVFRRV